MALRSLLSSPASRTPSPTRPSQLLFFLLTGSFLLTLVPHVEQLPAWVTLSVIAAMAVRSLLEIYHLPLPSTTFCALLAACFAAGILLQFHNVVGPEAGTAFTVGLLAIKFFELRGPRDVAMIIFSSFFVMMSTLLYSQAVELFIYCLIMFWVLTSLLLRTQLGDRPEDLLLRMLGQSGIILLQALPLALFLFFFFPRFSGKLQFSLNQNPLGLTDELKPGSVSKLAEDDSKAMYVRFKSGDVPAIDSMYWRALVLSQYINGEWKQGGIDNERVDPNSLPKGAPHSAPIVQEITVEPHFKKWIFALDSPVKVPSESSDASYVFTMLHGGVLRLNLNDHRTLDHRERYTATSFSELASEDLSPDERGIETKLPLDEIDPRVVDLAKQLRASKPDDEDYIFAVFHYLRHEHFAYSAAPGKEAPGHEKEWLADFLFKRKTGFCEHYASAFAILMRLGKIPARVVVGYHGAEFNPYANSYNVLQSNAHSWDEVWLAKQRRWVRYDPTAILSTAETAQPGSGQPGNDNSGETITIEVAHHQFAFLSTHNLPVWMRHTIQDLQLRRDQIESDWDDLIFSYDPDAQNRLARAMGLGEDNPATLIITCLMATSGCAFVFHRLMKRRQNLSPVEDLYAQFCRSMAQRGVLRADWEGPLAYTRRVAEAFPDKRAAIHDLGLIIARYRYGRAPVDPASPRQLKSLLFVITTPQVASSSRDN